MKEKYFINARIIDPSQNLDETGGLIVDANGKIKALGKSVKKGNIPAKSEKIATVNNNAVALASSVIEIPKNIQHIAPLPTIAL